jgi:spermidine synthase
MVYLNKNNDSQVLTPPVSSASKVLSRILKGCLFATGFAGLVAEFVLSTLASYLLGNAIFQWTIILSLMLFAMGLGSRMSKHIVLYLLDKFILIEYTLSLLCATCAVVCYTLAAYIPNQINLFIYSFSLLIGMLIGLEIPLVTRINDSYECLRVNISSIMEKDYYGALVGGLFFAFFALPQLGLTYTPLVLGAINFSVASILLAKFWSQIHYKRLCGSTFWIVCLILITLGITIKPIILFSEQARYRDKIIYEQQSLYQKIVITQWRDKYWLFINGNEQFSSIDEERYHEPLVHPALNLAGGRSSVLILGGGDGLGAREVLKYPEVEKITLVDLDPAMTTLAREHPVLLKLNNGSLKDPRVKVINKDAYRFLEDTGELYDVIIVDLPDPNSIELARLYSLEFYQLCRHHLKKYGVLVTQATSPFHSPKAFLSILKTMEQAGFTTLPYHNQIPTLGEWGWVLGIKSGLISPEKLHARAMELRFGEISTRFINHDALISMIHFGKGVFELKDSVRINTRFNPVLVKYYQQGLWQLD